jgi:hypothetical protein
MIPSTVSGTGYFKNSGGAGIILILAVMDVDHKNVKEGGRCDPILAIAPIAGRNDFGSDLNPTAECNGMQ